MAWLMSPQIEAIDNLNLKYFAWPGGQIARPTVAIVPDVPTAWH